MFNRFTSNSGSRPQRSEAEIHIWRVPLPHSVTNLRPPPRPGLTPSLLVPTWTGACLPTAAHLGMATTTERLFNRLNLWLDPAEQGRRDRFHFTQDRLRFVLCRGALRCVLAYYLGYHPSEVKLRAAPNGKPQLAGDAPPFRFNLSHTDGLCLIIVTRSLEVGIDVERIRPAVGAPELGPLVFSPREAARAARLSSGCREEHLLRTWVIKEAYLKATGTGLRTDPASLEAAELPALEFEPAPGFVAAAVALSVSSAECRLQWRDLFSPAQVNAPAEATETVHADAPGADLTLLAA